MLQRPDHGQLNHISMLYQNMSSFSPRDHYSDEKWVSVQVAHGQTLLAFICRICRCYKGQTMVSWITFRCSIRTCRVLAPGTIIWMRNGCRSLWHVLRSTCHCISCWAMQMDCPFRLSFQQGHCKQTVHFTCLKKRQCNEDLWPLWPWAENQLWPRFGFPCHSWPQTHTRWSLWPPESGVIHRSSLCGPCCYIDVKMCKSSTSKGATGTIFQDVVNTAVFGCPVTFSFSRCYCGREKLLQV